MLESVGSFAARRHRLVLAGIGLLFLILAVVGMGAFQVLQTGGQNDPNAPSAKAEALLASHFGGEQQLIVLVAGRHHASVNAPPVATIGRRVTKDLVGNPQITSVTSYWLTPSAGLRSSDGRSAIILAHITGSDNQVDDRTKALIPKLAALGGSVATVEAGGSAAAGAEIGTQVRKDLLVVSVVAVPITIVLLYFAFGSLAAALLPLAVAVLAIMGTFAELRVLSLVTSVSIYAIDLTIALGLGLAVDYSLLLVSRYREELADGADTYTAIARATAKAGRTIVFSALTVGVSLTALLVFPLYFLRSFAYAGISVVVFAVAGALLVMPALIAVFAARVVGRRPLTSADAVAESPFWRRLTSAVASHPIRFALPVVAALLVIGSPFLHVHFSTPDDRVLPTTASAHQVGDALRTEFSANAGSTLVVVGSGVARSADLGAYGQRLSEQPGVSDVEGVTGTYVAGHQVGPPMASYANGNIEYWSVRNHLDTTGAPAQALVQQVRAVPTPLGQSVLIGGPTADLVDQKHGIGASLPLAAGMIILATFIVLFLFTGSVLIPVKALVLNALTLFAVIGAMVWIFQNGHFSGLLGFTPTPTSTTMPPLLFVIAFGLSMDYEVFLLSRVKELHDQGMANRDAVVGGLARTGRIVTTAAALLSITFFAFGLSKISFIQFFGIGSGVAILVDATIVRGILVPAIMCLVGERIWWAPRVLRRLRPTRLVDEIQLSTVDSTPPVQVSEHPLEPRTGSGNSYPGGKPSNDFL